MKVRRKDISRIDLISVYLPGNYSDAFECSFLCKKEFTPDDFMLAFWTYSPKWIDYLFRLRDWIVKPFGIQAGSNRSKEKLKEAIMNGGNYGFVNVIAKSDNETLICADDKHLKMYFSIKLDKINPEQYNITVSSVVAFHNGLGYIYFYVIYPFHQLIVPSMIKHSIKKLLKSGI